MEEYDDLVPAPDAKGAVDMSGQGWKIIDESVWKMSLKILYLDLSSNKLVTLPEQIGELILLKELNVSSNSIEVNINLSLHLRIECE